MIQRYCPECDGPLAPADMNIQQGVALCPACGSLTLLARLAGLSQQGIDARNDSHDDGSWRDTPRGCKIRGWRGNVTVAASTRSLSTAMGLLFVSLFWNGIVSVFLVIALGGLYINLIGPLPDWAPVPTPTNGNSPMPLGMSLFLMLFLTPFLAVGTFLILNLLMAIAGSVKMRIHNDQAIASTGIGPLRWRRRFKVSEVTDVSIGEGKGWMNNNNNNKPSKAINIEAHDTIRVGGSLPENRMRWLCSVIKVLLTDPDETKVDELLASTDHRY